MIVSDNNNNHYKDELKKLIQLQQLDAEMYDLNARMDTFPVRIKEMDDSLEAKKTGMNEADKQLKELQVAKNERELEMKSKEENIKKDSFNHSNSLKLQKHFLIVANQNSNLSLP